MAYGVRQRVLRATLIGVLATVLFIPGCGGGGGETKTVTVDKTPESTPEATPEATATSEDEDDISGSGATSATCDELVPSDEEGTCEKDDLELTVVNRKSPLRLDDVTVRVQSIKTTRVLADPILNMPKTAEGIYVLMRLKVVNRTNGPASFNENEGQATLLIGENQYSSVDYEVQGPLEPLLIQETMQPEASKSGFIVFDLPRKAARKVKNPESGLVVFNFADAEAGVDSATSAGYIRLR